MGEKKTYAVVRTRFTGEHRWENAPEEVDFLRNNHRHEFHVEVKVEQFHDDRDVEYIMLKRKVDDIINEWPHDLDTTSCEMMCDDLYQALSAHIEGERAYVVKVFEDGENGAEVHYEP